MTEIRVETLFDSEAKDRNKAWYNRAITVDSVPSNNTPVTNQHHNKEMAILVGCGIALSNNLEHQIRNENGEYEHGLHNIKCKSYTK